MEIIHNELVQNVVDEKLKEDCRKSIIALGSQFFLKCSNEFIYGMVQAGKICNDDRKFVYAHVKPGIVLFDVTNRPIESVISDVLNIRPKVKKKVPTPGKVIVKMLHVRLSRMGETTEYMMSRANTDKIQIPDLASMNTLSEVEDMMNGISNNPDVRWAYRAHFADLKEVLEKPEFREEYLKEALDRYRVCKLLVE